MNQLTEKQREALNKKFAKRRSIENKHKFERCKKAWELTDKIQKFLGDSIAEFSLRTGYETRYTFMIGYWSFGDKSKTEAEKLLFLKKELDQLKKGMKAKFKSLKGVEFCIVNLCAVQVSVTI